MEFNEYLSDDEMDVWECECGTYTPVKKHNPKPVCELCDRRKKYNRVVNMGINIRQEGETYEDNKWIIEIKERWTIFNSDEEDSLIKFLRENMIPYCVDYTFEGIVINLNIPKKEIASYVQMKIVVERLLFYKSLFVNPKPVSLS